ncbi:erythromycin esterase family protein [Acidaminobacter sp. JC074]|uniref:hypothetical protein n=1 Tax=Acidaminobacter sp. JC074 TaxID=2530199 RepID=UPI001F0DB390|nr:hypothetical protein [Acidaminobacter sp. JC074]MCH4886294.1 erythromycin esterase family protein [Acidaminobacter sp. JC074]
MKAKFSVLLSSVLLCMSLMSCNNNAIEQEGTNNQVYAENESNEDQVSAVDQESNEVHEEVKLVDYDAIEDYLSSNYVDLDFDNDDYDEGLNTLDRDIESNEIFFTAEIHGVHANSELKMAFIKYFKDKANFKYLLSETSYSSSYFINRFLETGDRSILDMLFQAQNGTYADSEDNYNGWIDLYEFNKTLEDEEKIQVVGVDIEHQVLIAYNYMVSVLPDKEVPIELNETIEMIKETSEILKSTFTKDYLAIKNAQKTLDNIELNRSLYQDYLGDELIFFELVNQNIIGANEAYKHVEDKVDWNNTRDQIIYNNFLVLDDILEDGKYYGQWGLNHAFQRMDGGVKWFAGYLDSSESKYHNKVLSIAYNYENCESMSLKDTEPIKMNILYPVISNITNVSDSKYVLYKLNESEEERPFIPMIETWSGQEQDIDMNEYFQYILLIKDSEASKTH